MHEKTPYQKEIMKKKPGSYAWFFIEKDTGGHQ
jgi:hypothetical protein